MLLVMAIEVCKWAEERGMLRRLLLLKRYAFIPLDHALNCTSRPPPTAEVHELLHASLLSGGARLCTAPHPLLLAPAACAGPHPLPKRTSCCPNHGCWAELACALQLIHCYFRLRLRRPPPTAEEDELLRESLLSGGVDVEAGQAGTKKRQHSWISLVGIAAQYMWPDSFALQVRGRLSGWWAVRRSTCGPTRLLSR